MNVAINQDEVLPRNWVGNRVRLLKPVQTVAGTFAPGVIANVNSFSQEDGSLGIVFGRTDGSVRAFGVPRSDLQLLIGPYVDGDNLVIPKRLIEPGNLREAARILRSEQIDMPATAALLEAMAEASSQ